MTRKTSFIRDVQRTRCSSNRARRGLRFAGTREITQVTSAPRLLCITGATASAQSRRAYADGLWRCFASRPHAPITRKTRSIATADVRGSSMVRPSASSRISTTSASSRVMTVPANSSARTPSGSPGRPNRCTGRSNGAAANVAPGMVRGGHRIGALDRGRLASKGAHRLLLSGVPVNLSAGRSRVGACSLFVAQNRHPGGSEGDQGGGGRHSGTDRLIEIQTRLIEPGRAGERDRLLCLGAAGCFLW